MQISKKTSPRLTPAAEFQRSERCPVNLRWVIFHQKDSLQDFGAIIRLENGVGWWTRKNFTPGLRNLEEALAPRSGNPTKNNDAPPSRQRGGFKTSVVAGLSKRKLISFFHIEIQDFAILPEATFRP